MAEIRARGTEEGKEVSVAEILKTLVYRSLSSPGLPTSVGIKAHEILREKAPLEYGGWDVLYEAPSQSAARKGLKLVDELELSEVKSQVNDLNARVESVVSELQQCKEGISAILDELNELREKPITKQTELFEIDESLEVIRPIPVVIEEYEDEVIATFPEIEAFGAGLCEAEAIINLKNEIRKIYFELEGVSDDKLGKLPLSWKRVLLKVVKKIGVAR